MPGKLYTSGRRGFPTFLGKVRNASRTLSGLFVVGAFNRTHWLRKRKRTNQEISESIGKFRKNQEAPKRTKRKDKSRSGTVPV